MHREDLEVLLRTRVPLIVVDSRDEAQVLKALARACSRQSVRFRPQPLTPTRRTPQLRHRRT